MRTPWELDGITLGTKETKKVSPSLPPPPAPPLSAQKEKKGFFLNACHTFSLAA